MRRYLIAAMLGLGACTATAAVEGDPASAVAGETIRLETGPCFGSCPVYAVTVRPDGTGQFEGKRFTAITGVRAFTASREAYARFAATLAPARPTAGDRRVEPGQPGCGNAPTDMPSTSVRWSGADGERNLFFYHGCAIENRGLADALRSAPATLPIAELIGPPQVGR